MAQQHAELDKQLADRDFLCGDISVADIGTFIMVSAGATLGAPVGERCTNLRGWLARLGKRPSFANEMISMQSFLAGVLNSSS
jgi:glutathione S-transferase